MREKKKLRIIPHTHWDKEWYFTAARSLMYSLRDFDELLEVLQTNQDFLCFHLDGQLSIIEEYLEVHPEKQKLLTDLVQANRLIIGPWYTQPDTLVISGENLIKNLEIGTLLAKKYGRWQSIGYLPDSFGMSAQMPQIYKQFGLQFAFFRRGFATHLVNNREFIWESLDGSRLFTHHLHHYGNMAYPPNQEDALLQYYDRIEQQLTTSTQSDTILLYNGEDQKPIRKNLPDLVNIGKKSGWDIEIATLETVLCDLKEFYRQHHIDLPIYKGEFTFGQFSRVHKSIFSTRADLKKLNNQLEHFLANIVQPLCNLAAYLGLNGEQILRDKIWKLLLLNAAHDSIGNCNSDETNDDIYSRYIQAKRLSEELVDFKLREIGNHIEQVDITQFQVYNFLPYKRSDYVQVTLYSPFATFSILDSDGQFIDFHLDSIEDVRQTFLKKSIREIGVDNQEVTSWSNQIESLFKCHVKLFCKDVPSMGYRTYRLVNAESCEEFVLPTQARHFSIENERYRIRFDKGKIELYDKITEFSHPDFIQILDDGDEGDSYDYSTPRDDKQIYGEFVNCRVQQSRFRKSLSIKGKLQLPSNLMERNAGTFSLQQDFELTIALDMKSDAIFVHVQTMNVADEHRLRVVFQSGRSNAYSFADTQFGTMKRPTILQQVEVWEREKWDEKPRTIEPFISYVSNGFTEGSVQIISDGVREYQFIGEDYQGIAMTLYRSIPFLGKSDLQDRPGRESGTKVKTEGTRHMHQVLSSSYYVRILNSLDDEYTCANMAKACFTPLMAYQSAPYKNNTDMFVLSVAHQTILPLDYSMFEINSPIVLSTIDRHRDGQSSVLRCFNPYLEKNILFSKDNFYSSHIVLDGVENCLGERVQEISDILLTSGQFVNWKVTN